MNGYFKSNRNIRRKHINNIMRSHTQLFKKKLEKLNCDILYERCINNYIFDLEQLRNIDINLLFNDDYTKYQQILENRNYMV